MAEMKRNEILKAVKENALKLFKPLLDEQSSEQTDDYTYAFLVDVGDGKEHWVEVNLTAKDLMVDENGKRVPYDPFVKQADWQAECEIKAEAAAERERKHAETVKKAAERKAKAAERAKAKRAQAK